MKYRMVVRRTMFDFDFTKKGKLKLQSVRFLNDSIMKQKNDVLLISDKNQVHFFLDNTTPVSKLSREQFIFMSAASRFFGYMPGQKQLPVWLWAGKITLPDDQFETAAGTNMKQPPVVYS